MQTITNLTKGEIYNKNLVITSWKYKKKKFYAIISKKEKKNKKVSMKIKNPVFDL